MKKSATWVCPQCGTTNDVERDGDKCGFCNRFRDRVHKLYRELAAG